MTDKELKRLSRADLVEIIYQLQQEKENLAAENDQLQTALQRKELKVKNAGSLAEAAAEIAGLLERAQETADLYLHNIAEMQREEEAKLEVIRRGYKKVIGAEDNCRKP